MNLSSDATNNAIAIIGMAGRFPGAANIDEFWRNLVGRVESVRWFGDDEIECDFAKGESLTADSRYIKARPILDDVDLFDAGFFGITPRDAELMDPQHRVFLECAWNALEDGGYDPSRFPGQIGVFGGQSLNTYLLSNLCSHREFIEELVGQYQVGGFNVVLGNDKDYLATRVSYKLNLHGPSITVQSACSTSLVAVVQACQSLLLYECDMALAGGVSITFPQRRGYLYQEGGMVSADGHCRTFDANASGTVFGSGAGVVLIKRFEDAVGDGDHIYAVIRGTAINNDGSEKVGYTAPSVERQAEVVAAAQAVADVSAESVSYIETHGTGTPLGDPIEVAALTKAFRADTDKKAFCGIGSVKTNIGHLEIASGVTGLIKTALSLDRELIPATINFESPNPELEIEESPFYVVDKAVEWKRGDKPRRAGVSSFGVGGTNAHVVLEEAPVRTTNGSREEQLLLLSAKTETALNTAADRLAEYLERDDSALLDDVAFTLTVGRREFEHRAMLVCSGKEEAAQALRDRKRLKTARSSNPKLFFVFPGQGTQEINMSRGIYESEPEFRADVDECAEILHSDLGFDIREVLFPTPETESDARERLNRTSVTQPALFVIEYCLARLWQRLGVQPDGMIGHSVGEYAAACLSGVLSLKDALHLLAERGRLTEELPGGSMLAVRISEDDLGPYVGDGFAIASVNAPNLCVLSGTDEMVEDLRKRLDAAGIASKLLQTSHAFHSPMIEPILPQFEAIFDGIRLNAPQLPYVSTLTGNWVTAEDVVQPEYWSRHFRETVRFMDGIRVLSAEPDAVFLEVGPGGTLSRLVRQIAKENGSRALNTLGDDPEPLSDRQSLQNATGQLWMHGIAIDWNKYYENKRRSRVSLPTYPFERKKFWIAPEPAIRSGRPAIAQPQPGSTVAQTELAKEEVLKVNSQANDGNSRRDLVARALSGLFEELSGIEASAIDAEATFLELGFDSLFLTQVSQAIGTRFGVKVAFRQMLDDVCTLVLLTEFVDSKVAEDHPIAQPVKVESVPSVAAPESAPVVAIAPNTAQNLLSDPQQSPVERVIQQQLAAMQQLASQQLAMLREAGLDAGTPSRPAPETHAERKRMIPMPAPVAASKAPKSAKPFTPFRPMEKGKGGRMTDRQQRSLAEIIENYVGRTMKSKEITQRYRSAFADPRAVAGFRSQWKEIVYPLVVGRSSGSRLWDVDGNEYIDMLNGFGVTLFGHAPEFVSKAVEDQLKNGYEIGPMSHLAGEVAGLICELTGNERATFCNTGSEAVQGALRLARTVTGRNLVVTFAGSYHGGFDEVLVRPNNADGYLQTAPAAPGIPQENVDNVIVLDYGSPEALQVIRENADRLAAVLVEPVQSRRPGLQPAEFLKEIRKITEDSGTALIFDEVVTGFRSHPGGAQAIFGIRADLVTYGKVIGGGMPIGVISGNRRFMDALDGGDWCFGDNSAPEAGVTFYAGTFFRHPLALAAAHASLTHLKEQGPALQQRLSEKTEKLVARINGCFEINQIPTRIDHFASIFYLHFPVEERYASLLYVLLRTKGVHILENYPCFVTTAHTDEELETVARAFEESVAEMQEYGFFAEPSEFSSDDRSDVIDDSHATRVPLTEAQKEIWNASQLGDDAARAYNDSVVAKISGVLDIEAVRWSFAELVTRHEALRTTFDTSGEFQLVNAERTVEIPLIDLSGKSDDERKTEFARILADEATTVLDLASGPLMRVQIVSMSHEEHFLVLVAHHIICDGWSFAVLLSELCDLYSAKVSGSSAALPAAAKFSEFVKWDFEQMFGPDGKAAEAYWLAQFSEAPPALDLPYDRPRPANKTFNASVESIVLDESLYKALKKLGATGGSTLFTTLLTGYFALLNRLSGQSDIVVAVPAAGQSMIGEEHLVGHCANLLPVRSMILTDESFAGYLKRTKSTVLDAYEHQNYTYGVLVQKLGLPRDPSRSPLLSAMFNIDRSGFKGLSMGDCALEITTNRKAFATFDIYFNMLETDQGVVVDCEYNTDLFDSATIRRWLAHYRTLLSAAANDPEVTVSRLPLLDADETAWLVEKLNSSRRDYSREQSLPAIIEEQASRTPHSVAVEFENESLTYAELDEKANALANYLLDNGVGRDSLVGICVERSTDMIVGLLGILKAGAAYVPIDPAYPSERINSIIEDSGVDMFVAHAHLAFDLRERVSRVICIDIEWDKVERYGFDRPEVTPGSDDLAYVIYTSGSTGKPKGVGIEHRALVNFLESMKEEPGIEPDDVLVAVTTISFDIAGLELFLPLIAGARVVIASRETATDGNALSELVEGCGASLMQATPATWRLLLEAGWKGSKSFKLLCGGEALPRDLANQLLERSESLWNMYGPTETTIWSSISRIGTTEGPVDLGHPIGNTQLHVLDENLQLVPVGVPGELHIGGDGLARGYFNRPDLTAEKFIPDPFAKRGGARLYKTGDLVRRNADGDLEFLGRIDHQVKIRGYRIELGEIETALAAHPSVSAAVVTAHEFAPGDKRLAAYVVAEADAIEGGEELGDSSSFWEDQWNILYSNAIAEENDWTKVSEDPTLKVVRWTDDVVDAEAEMEQWIQPVVDRLKGLNAKRVLEIGCGTGHLLFALAPDCERFVGTDYSGVVLENLKERLAATSIDPTVVDLIHRRADDLDGFADESFDLVIIHSVIQYFPNMEYLDRVIKGVCRLVKPGGHVFVGDVQNFALLETFHAESIIARSDRALRISDLRQKIRNRVEIESELTVDPDYFAGLAGSISEAGSVDVRLRRGRIDNEPTKYHYDVMLRIGGEPTPAVAGDWNEWNEDSFGLSRLDSKLKKERPERICISEIPNARIAVPVAACLTINGSTTPETIDALMRDADGAERGIHPEELHELCERLGYAADLRPAGNGASGRFDAVLTRLGSDLPRVKPRRIPARRDIAEYGNDPVNKISGQRLAGDLRTHLSSKLPEYMVPAAFVVLDEFPLTPNGKVDRKRLPQPDAAALSNNRHFDPPTNDQEAALAAIFAKVLRVDRVGINDDIFELGGDSLLIFQIVTRATQAGITIKPKDVFEYRTVSEIVRSLSTVTDSSKSAVAPTIGRVSRVQKGGQAGLTAGNTVN